MLIKSVSKVKHLDTWIKNSNQNKPQAHQNQKLHLESQQSYKNKQTNKSPQHIADQFLSDFLSYLWIELIS